MSIFVDENTKVVYQGLTGSQGRYYGLLNREYGTQVVAGTNPKKAGEDVEGIPIFASVADAVAPVSFTASATEAKIGMSSTSVPAFLGLVPATTFVPYALLRPPWKLPWPPVRPW